MGRIGRRKSAVKLIVLAAVLLTATILAGVLIQNQNQTTNRLICQNIFLHINTPTNQYISAKAYVSITSPSDGEILPTENVGVTWTSNETVDHYETRLDGGGWTNVGTNTSQTFTNLSEGLHTVEVMVFDESAGNDTDDVTFTVDTTSPTVTITYPEDDALLPTGDLTVTWNSVDTDIAYYNVSVDGGAWENMGLNTGYDLIGLPDDPHTFNVTAVDQAGNTGFDVVSFTVDTTSPTVNITYPSDDALLSSSDVTVTWNSPDSDIAYYNVSIDGGAWENVGLNTSYDLSLGDGLHNVNVTAVDLAGLSGFDSVSFTVDTTPPTVNITSPSSDSVNTGVIWINGTFDGTGSNVVSITINDSARFELVEPSGAGPFGESGSYAFRSSTTIPTGGLGVLVTVEDQANLTGTATVNFIVDQDNPIVTIDQPPSDDTINTGIIWINGTFDGTGSEVTSITINDTTWFELVEPSGAGPYGVSGTYAFRNKTAIPTGEYVVLVTVEDQANLTGTATRNVIVDQDDPTVDIAVPVSDTTVNTGVIWINGTYDGTGSNVTDISINDTLRFTLVTSGPFGVTGTYSFRNSTPIATEEFDIQIMVTDQVSLTGIAQRHIIVDQDNPTVIIEEPPSDGSVNTGVIWINGTYDGTGSNVTDISCDDNRFDLQISPPFNATGNYYFVNNTPIATGEFWVQVTVTDQAGLTGTTTRRVLVDQDAPIVTIEDPSSGDVKTGVIWINGTFDGTGSNVVSITINDSARFELVEPTWPYGETGSYAFRSNTTIPTGELSVEVTVQDQAGHTEMATVNFIVDQDNPTVDITTPESDTTVNTGVIWINGTFDGTGSQVMSITINDTRFNLVEPVGVGPYGETGSYSFNASGIGTGDFYVVITVQDQAGLTGTASRHVIVDQDDPTVTIEDPSSGDVKTGVIWINGTFDGTGSDVVSITINYPAWFELVEPVGSFSETGSYAFRSNTTIPTGGLSVVVTVEDQAGHVGTANVNFIVDQDNPTVVIIEPYSDDTINTGVIWIIGSYNGTGSVVQSIEINDIRFELVAGPPFGITGTYSFRNKTGIEIPTGEFWIRVTVTDGANLIGYAERRVIVDQTIPDVEITVPVNDYVVSTGVIWINGTYDGRGSNIQNITCDDGRFILQNGQPFGVAGTFSFVNNTPIETSEFWVIIMVTDQANLTGYDMRRLRVDQDQPTVSITIPASDFTVNTGVVWVNGIYNGTGSEVVNITINVLGFTRMEPLGNGPFGLSGSYSFMASGLGTGEFDVVVTVKDQVNLTRIATRHVIVDQSLPTITITTPFSDDTINVGTIIIRGEYNGTGSNIMSITCNDSFRFTLQNVAPFGETGTYVFINSTNIYDGDYDLMITVRDSAGFESVIVRHVKVKQSGVTGSGTWERNGINQYIDAVLIAGVELWLNTTAPVKVYITCTTTNLGGNASAGFGFSGSFWSISVNDTSAVQGVTIIIRYSDENITSAGIAEGSLRIRYWDDTSGKWIEIPSTLDIENNMVTAYTNHLTNFAVLGTLLIPIIPGTPFYLEFLLISQLLPSGSNTLVYLAIGLSIIAIVTVMVLLLMGGRKRREAIEAVAPPTLVRTQTSAKPGCFYCGSDIPGDSEYCPYCGETRARCSVCNRYMLSGERFAECPYCDAVSHTDHLLEWVNSKGYCPTCKEKLFTSHVKLKDYFERR